jgi:hypothetical protein
MAQRVGTGRQYAVLNGGGTPQMGRSEMASTATTSVPHVTTCVRYHRAVEVVLREGRGVGKGQAFFNAQNRA